MNDIDLVKLKNDIHLMRTDVMSGVETNYQSKYIYLFEKTPSIFFLIKDNEEENSLDYMLIY